jgi:hypothetical protein
MMHRVHRWRIGVLLAGTLAAASVSTLTISAPAAARPAGSAAAASGNVAGVPTVSAGEATLPLDVAVGGPLCDAVTVVDVVESADRVSVSVYAGATGQASCGTGVRAMVGTVRVAAHLARPLGSRTLVDGATG